MSLSLVVPLCNEAKNIPQFVEEFASSNFSQLENFELILVNNGSTDNSQDLLTNFEKIYQWIRAIRLEQNRNYGGAIDIGLAETRNKIVGFLSGDLQTSCDDVENVWQMYLKISKMNLQLLVKGRRTGRTDPFASRVVSFVYTIICNLILGCRVRDINGLPKIFLQSLMAPMRLMKEVHHVS